MTDDAKKFLTKSACYLLIVTKGIRGIDIIDDLTNFIGLPDKNLRDNIPEDVRAKQLRTIYGTDDIRDGFYFSSTEEISKRLIGYNIAQLKVGR